MNPSGAAHTGHDTRPKLKVELGTYNGGGDLCNSDVELLCSTGGGQAETYRGSTCVGQQFS